MLRLFNYHIMLLSFYCISVCCYAETSKVHVSEEVLQVLDDLKVSAAATTVTDFLKPFSTEFIITEISNGKVVGTWNRESALDGFRKSKDIITDYQVTREIISVEVGTKNNPGAIKCRTKEELNFNGKNVSGATVEKISFVRVDGKVKINAITYEIEKKKPN